VVEGVIVMLLLKVDHSNPSASEAGDEAACSIKDADGEVPRHPAITAALSAPSPQHHHLQPCMCLPVLPLNTSFVHY